jgi:sugar phosphate isomerase/epimerase
MKIRQMITVTLAGLVLAAGARADQPAPPKFYAYCLEMGVPKVKPRPLAEQAKILREIGFDGTAQHFWLDPKELDESLRTFDKAGLAVYMLYAGVKVKPGEQAYDPLLPDAIRKLKGRPVTVCVTMTGLKAADPQGMEPAVKALRELGDVAAQAGVRISIYQHVNNWTESLPFIFEVVKRVNPGKIFCVTICGAEIGSPKWTDGLIQPLDRGNFNNRRLLDNLREIGYRGPIGLMCYGVPGDPREHLRRSMNVWKSWTRD